jgi:hypothetical protein
MPVSTSEELLAAYLKINGSLRKTNAATIAAFAAETETSPFWNGAFRQLSNSQVESGFADYRTYLYDGKEVDQQVHLGFDLATTATAPVEAAHTPGEGVETQDECDYLIRHGCTEAQGYFFGRPKPAGEILELLSEGRVRARAVA